MTNNGNLQNSLTKMTPMKTFTPANTSPRDTSMDRIDNKQDRHRQSQSVNSTNGTVMKNMSSLSSTLFQDIKQGCTVTELGKTKDNNPEICELNTTRSTKNDGEINIISLGSSHTKFIVIVPKDTPSLKQERAKSEISHLSKVQIPETPLRLGIKPMTSMSTVSISLQAKKKEIAEARKARLEEIRGKVYNFNIFLFITPMKSQKNAPSLSLSYSILLLSQKKTPRTVGIKDLKYNKILLSNNLNKKKLGLNTSFLYSSSRKAPHLSLLSSKLMNNPKYPSKLRIGRKQILAKQIHEKAATKKHQLREHIDGSTTIISATKKSGHILNTSLDTKTPATKTMRNMSTSKKLRVKSSSLQQLSSKKPLSPMNTYVMSDRADSDDKIEK